MVSSTSFHELNNGVPINARRKKDMKRMNVTDRQLKRRRVANDVGNDNNNTLHYICQVKEIETWQVKRLDG
jgi:hypothetical protein